MAAIKAIVEKRSHVLKGLVRRAGIRSRGQRTAGKAMSVFAGMYAQQTARSREVAGPSQQAGKASSEVGTSSQPQSLSRSGSSGRFLASCAEALSDNEAGALEASEARAARGGSPPASDGEVSRRRRNRRGSPTSEASGVSVSDGEESTVSRRRRHRRRSLTSESGDRHRRSRSSYTADYSEHSERRRGKRRAHSPRSSPTRRSGSSPVRTTRSGEAGPSRSYSFSEV